MHFCEKCDNMYYIKIKNNDNDSDSDIDENRLIYYCRKCGNENTNLSKDDICVSKEYMKQSKYKYNSVITPYTIKDPTLPRSKTIICPSCSVNNKSQNDNDKEDSSVIYIRYDEENIKYVYLCSKCNTTWKTIDRK